MIFLARAGPMPGSVSKSSELALLMSTRSAFAAALAADFPAGAFRAGLGHEQTERDQCRAKHAENFHSGIVTGEAASVRYH